MRWWLKNEREREKYWNKERRVDKNILYTDIDIDTDTDNHILSHPPRHRPLDIHTARARENKELNAKYTVKQNNGCFWFVWKVCLLLYNLFSCVCIRAHHYINYFIAKLSLFPAHWVRHGKKPPSYFFTFFYIVIFFLVCWYYCCYEPLACTTPLRYGENKMYVFVYI